MKKTLLLLFALSTVGLASAQFTDGLFSYKLVGGDAFISGSTAIGEITFPETATDGVTTYNVTGVHTDYSTSGSTGITSATFPSSYKTYQANCLRGMPDLISLNFIGGESFGSKICRGLLSLRTVVLPNTITSWGVEIFSESTSLESISLGNCPEINNRMFRNTNVTSLTLPATITAISSNGWNNSSVTTLIVEGSTPPAIAVDWGGTATAITAYVPDADVAAYSAAPIWADMTIQARSSLSTKSAAMELGFTMYPNPTNGLLTIQNKKGIEALVSVYDINGSALLTQEVSSLSAEINMSNLPSGVYLLKVNVENTEFVKRIVKL